MADLEMTARTVTSAETEERSINDSFYGDKTPSHLSVNLVVQKSDDYEGPTEIFDADLQRELAKS